MSGGGPSPPTPYDPYSVAGSQYAYNTAAAAQTFAYANTAAIESLEANAMNQYTPLGSTTYQQTGTGANGIPIYSVTQSLSPEEQALYGYYTGGQAQLGNMANQLLEATGNQYTTAPDLTGTTNSLTANMLQNEVASLQPYFNVQNTALTDQLASEGMAPTQGGANGTVDPAWASAEMALQGNQNQAVSGFLASAQPAAFQEAEQQYLLPEQLATSMLGVATPSFPSQLNTPGTNVQAPTVQPPDLEGAVGQAESAQEATYQAQEQQYSAMLSGLFGIGSAAAGGLTFGMAKSYRLRKWVLEHVIRTTKDGVPIRRFKYMWERVDEPWHEGVMSDDVKRIYPWRVIQDIWGDDSVYLDPAWGVT
jgi:hypothetical protein